MAALAQAGSQGDGGNALLWWVVPGKLAGMAMPYIHVARRMNGGGALNDYDDELRLLHSNGIRAVVCLLNIPGDRAVYERAGFRFLLLPIPDGNPPTEEQAWEMIQFVRASLADNLAVAIHCEAGLGRTGTCLAAYLVAEGMSARDAIASVRSAQPAAIETYRQIRFLESFEEQPKESPREQTFSN